MKTVIALLALTFFAPASPVPTVEVDRARAKVGETVTVDMAAWPSGNVLVELCGNGGERGSADCAVAAAATTFVNKEGRGTAMVTVVRPPIGCPCVISARPVTGGRARTAPLAIDGVPTLSATQRRTVSTAPARDLTVSGVGVSGGASLFGSLFGGPAKRTVTFTVRNTGQAPITDPPLALAVGRGDTPTGIVDAPRLGTLQPGGQRTYTVPVTIPGPAFGRYTIVGELTGIDRPARFTARTSSYPWAFPVLLALTAPLVLLRPRRRVAALPASGTITMNQVVAANIVQWRRTRNLSAADLAQALAPLTNGRWTAQDIAEAETTSHRFDVDDLLAFSRALDIPLPALLLPPTGYDVVPRTPDRV